METYPRIGRFRAIASIPGLRSPSALTRRASEGCWPRPARDPAGPRSCALGWYGHKRGPGRLFPAGRLTHHRKQPCRSSKPREALAPGTARRRALGNKEFVRISRCSFEFRLGAGIIGSSKNRSNLMQIINFHLGARMTGTPGHFVVSLEAPSYYGWAQCITGQV